MDKACLSTQLIGGDGTFNAIGFKNFTDATKLAQSGSSYGVVSIMGPQSSGKSTLMNDMYGTNFQQMDATKGRSQTTNGIWLARAVGVEPLTLVMDLEGNDGRERGENDTTFEKQIALFGLAVSDILLINMWYHDVGREQAANKPLLRVIFEVYMTKFPNMPKKTLLFVVRDNTETSVGHLAQILIQDTREIWNSVSKRKEHQGASLDDFFEVYTWSLPNREFQIENFKTEVAALKQWIHSKVHSGHKGRVPGPGFYTSCQNFWQDIQQNKSLNLPSHKVLVATACCQEIADVIYADFSKSKGWGKLNEKTQSGTVPGFGKNLSQMIHHYLYEYESKAGGFDENVKSKMKQNLLEKILQLAQPKYRSVVAHMRCEALEEFKKGLDAARDKGKKLDLVAPTFTDSTMAKFDERCKDAFVEQANWDTYKERDHLRRDVDSYIHKLREQKRIKEEENRRVIIQAAKTVAVGAGLIAATTVDGGTSLACVAASSLGLL